MKRTQQSPVVRLHCQNFQSSNCFLTSKTFRLICIKILPEAKNPNLLSSVPNFIYYYFLKYLLCTQKGYDVCLNMK